MAVGGCIVWRRAVECLAICTNAAYVDRGRLFVPELAALRAIAQSGAVIPADPDDRAGAEAAEPAEGSQGRAAIAGQPRWESRYPHHGEAALAS